MGYLFNALIGILVVYAVRLVDHFAKLIAKKKDSPRKDRVQ